LTKNAGSIKIATKITDGYNISYPFQTVEPFVSTWEFTEEMSLLEGLVIYMDGGDPTVSIYAKRLFLDTEFKQFNLEQFDQEKDVINSSEHKKMLRKNTIITCIGAMHYDTDSKKRISSLLDWYLIKIIADTYNVLSDADLKFIAGCRPGSITAYLSSRYNPYYNFTNTQLTRLKKAGFQIEQSQHSDDTPNTTDKELDQ
jgi:hypothetical protein